MTEALCADAHSEKRSEPHTAVSETEVAILKEKVAGLEALNVELRSRVYDLVGQRDKWQQQAEGVRLLVDQRDRGRRWWERLSPLPRT